MAVPRFFNGLRDLVQLILKFSPNPSPAPAACKFNRAFAVPYTWLFFARDYFVDLPGGVCGQTINQYAGFRHIFSRAAGLRRTAVIDRKSTRLNSSHVKISYAVFCLKKK